VNTTLIPVVGRCVQRRQARTSAGTPVRTEDPVTKTERHRR
jgi:hypothetical protein